jgi:hypothetical protein
MKETILGCEVETYGEGRMRSLCGTLHVIRTEDKEGDISYELDVCVSGHFRVTTHADSLWGVERNATCIIEETLQACSLLLGKAQ